MISPIKTMNSLNITPTGQVSQHSGNGCDFHQAQLENTLNAMSNASFSV
jgi:hypothetical protein